MLVLILVKSSTRCLCWRWESIRKSYRAGKSWQLLLSLWAGFYAVSPLSIFSAVYLAVYTRIRTQPCHFLLVFGFTIHFSWLTSGAWEVKKVNGVVRVPGEGLSDISVFVFWRRASPPVSADPRQSLSANTTYGPSQIDAAVVPVKWTQMCSHSWTRWSGPISCLVPSTLLTLLVCHAWSYPCTERGGGGAVGGGGGVTGGGRSNSSNFPPWQQTPKTDWSWSRNPFSSTWMT